MDLRDVLKIEAFVVVGLKDDTTNSFPSIIGKVTNIDNTHVFLESDKVTSAVALVEIDFACTFDPKSAFWE